MIFVFASISAVLFDSDSTIAKFVLIVKAELFKKNSFKLLFEFVCLLLLSMCSSEEIDGDGDKDVVDAIKSTFIVIFLLFSSSSVFCLNCFVFLVPLLLILLLLLFLICLVLSFSPRNDEKKSSSLFIFTFCSAFNNLS